MRTKEKMLVEWRELASDGKLGFPKNIAVEEVKHALGKRAYDRIMAISPVAGVDEVVVEAVMPERRKKALREFYRGERQSVRGSAIIKVESMAYRLLKMHESGEVVSIDHEDPLVMEALVLLHFFNWQAGTDALEGSVDKASAGKIVPMPDASIENYKGVTIQPSVEELLDTQSLLVSVDRTKTLLMIESFMERTIRPMKSHSFSRHWELYQDLFLADKRLSDRAIAEKYFTGAQPLNSLRGIKHRMREKTESLILAHRLLLRGGISPRSFLLGVVKKRMMETPIRFQVWMDVMAGEHQIDTERKYRLKNSSYEANLKNIRSILLSMTDRDIDEFLALTDGEALAILKAHFSGKAVAYKKDPLGHQLFQRKVAIEKALEVNNHVKRRKPVEAAMIMDLAGPHCWTKKVISYAS